MAAPRTEKAYEKHAWILLFAIGVFSLLGAITHIAGQAVTDVDFGTAGTALANFVRFDDRELGINLAAFSVLVIAISRTSYRKGDRWAWNAMWIVPVYILGLMANTIIAGQASFLFFIPFLVAALLGLLLPYRKFFPKTPEKQG